MSAGSSYSAPVPSGRCSSRFNYSISRRIKRAESMEGGGGGISRWMPLTNDDVRELIESIIYFLPLLWRKRRISRKMPDQPLQLVLRLRVHSFIKVSHLHLRHFLHSITADHRGKQKKRLAQQKRILNDKKGGAETAPISAENNKSDGGEKREINSQQCN